MEEEAILGAYAWFVSSRIQIEERKERREELEKEKKESYRV